MPIRLIRQVPAKQILSTLGSLYKKGKAQKRAFPLFQLFWKIFKERKFEDPLTSFSDPRDEPIGQRARRATAQG